MNWTLMYNSMSDSSSDETKKEIDERECSICIQPVNDEDINFLPCFHYFHVSCIQKWLQIKRLCPLCKTAVDEPASSEPTNHPMPLMQVFGVPLLFQDFVDEPDVGSTYVPSGQDIFLQMMSVAGATMINMASNRYPERQQSSIRRRRRNTTRNRRSIATTNESPGVDPHILTSEESDGIQRMLAQLDLDRQEDFYYPPWNSQEGPHRGHD
jgi:hypothetical protein